MKTKCWTCKFWWPNTPKGVVEGANRKLKHRCLRRPGALVGGQTSGCRSYRGFKRFFMVPWDAKTFIKIEADSRDEMLDKIFGIAHKIAEPIIQSIVEP